MYTDTTFAVISLCSLHTFFRYSSHLLLLPVLFSDAGFASCYQLSRTVRAGRKMNNRDVHHVHAVFLPGRF
jgi:hypothetical protein